jgi:hypothetical protein
MFIQLNPPIPLRTSRGSGWAHFVIDYGMEADLIWVVFLDESGECWSFNNREIRAVKNYTFGRVPPETDIPGACAKPGRAEPRPTVGAEGLNGGAAPFNGQFPHDGDAV